MSHYRFFIFLSVRSLGLLRFGEQLIIIQHFNSFTKKCRGKRKRLKLQTYYTAFAVKI